MENSIMVIFSVIAIFIAVGSIYGIIDRGKGLAHSQIISVALSDLELNCKYICQSNDQGKFNRDIELPSGIILYTKSQKICINNYGDIKCKLCGCPLTNYTLDLNSSFSKDAYDKHTFVCEFSEHKGVINLECQG